MLLIAVRPIKNDYARGLKYAKRLCKWDSLTKTWTIPEDAPQLGNLKAYGLELIEMPHAADIGTDHITDDRFALDGGSLSEAMEDEHSSL